MLRLYFYIYRDELDCFHVRVTFLDICDVQLGIYFLEDIQCLSSASSALNLCLSKVGESDFHFKSSITSFMLTSASCLHALLVIFKLFRKNVTAYEILLLIFYSCALNSICHTLNLAPCIIILNHELSMHLALVIFVYDMCVYL